ncbi:bifunctional diaminohydroxyphosphoribosylaminopyrimidine deaminase/5-amino-6-(5-phosphoribosylamino)uracil reductase RibD [Candidatus Omnitrophota bacterium]
MTRKKHEQFMKRAILLAKRAEGKTFPNPVVGAVVVKKGRITGEGYHKKAGTAHAEIIALRRAGKNAKAAELYITLEPCSHYGKTPPCVDAILKSGVKKVYVAMKDPNPLVNGRGLRTLRKNGIKAESGICRREARGLNPIYIKSVKKKKR